MGVRARGGLAAALAVGLVIGGMATPVGVAAQEPSDDRHAGYYYPEHGTPEVYDARAYTLPDASRKARIAFVTSITNEQNKAPYPPQAAIFAKGTEAEKLIIDRSDEHTTTIQSLMRSAYAAFCLKKIKLLIRHIKKTTLQHIDKK